MSTPVCTARPPPLLCQVMSALNSISSLQGPLDVAVLILRQTLLGAVRAMELRKEAPEKGSGVIAIGYAMLSPRSRALSKHSTQAWAPSVHRGHLSQVKPTAPPSFMLLHPHSPHLTLILAFLCVRSCGSGQGVRGCRARQCCPRCSAPPRPCTPAPAEGRCWMRPHSPWWASSPATPTPPAAPSCPTSTTPSPHAYSKRFGASRRVRPLTQTLLPLTLYFPPRCLPYPSPLPQ
jgi:hypothetical protein